MKTNTETDKERAARMDEEIAGGVIPADLTIEDMARGHADCETARASDDSAGMRLCAIANLVEMAGDRRRPFPGEGLEAEIAQRLGLLEGFRAAWDDARDWIVETQTHYTDARGQHYLPACLVRRKLAAGDIILAADEVSALSEPDAAEIRQAAAGLGIEIEDMDGDWGVA